MQVAAWHEFASEAPELAQFAQERLGQAPSYLATVRADGWPRVHPVGPLTPRDGQLVVVMYPTSPKGQDLRRNAQFALHASVEGQLGGEVLLTGQGQPTEPSETDIASGYIAFALLIGEILATRYDELGLNPSRERWRADGSQTDRSR